MRSPQSGPEASEAGPDPGAGWLAAASDPTAFRAEQDRFRYLWTFLGFASDAAGDGDWFRASLGGRSVFVQRSGGVLRGFENRCAHRGYPIRTQDKGTGPIVCGLHHWRYDEEGRAVGIPMSRQVFGASPGELDLGLPQLDVGLCGQFVFGRFPSDGVVEPLEACLGPGFKILEAMSAGSHGSTDRTHLLASNWRFFSHLTMDDYHLAAVHPTTSGRNNYYLKPDDLDYHRFGLHSLYLWGDHALTLDGLARDCANGDWRSESYFILSVFPNLIISHAASVDRYIFVSHLTPLAPDRTRLTSRIYPLDRPLSVRGKWIRRFAPLAWAAGWVVRRISRRVLMEDIVAAGRLQETAAQMDVFPMLGAYEERLGWFEENYRRVMEGAEAPR